MNKLASIISYLVIFLAMASPSHAADLDGLVASLKHGGYVLVFRHGATDDSQKDVYPFKSDDMAAQRQLNEKGRHMARELGEALKKLGVPIGGKGRCLRASSIAPLRPASCLAARTSFRWMH